MSKTLNELIDVCKEKFKNDDDYKKIVDVLEDYKKLIFGNSFIKELEQVEDERKYVVICNRYKGIAGSVLFWGRYTEDDEKRSFGGYDSDFSRCEKYTLEEIKNSGYKFPIYGQEVHKDNYKQFEDFAIEIKRLKMLGYRPITIYYR